MDEFPELATAGLVVTLAGVLLVLSYFFIAVQSAKHPWMNASYTSPIKANQVTFYQARDF
ncbi:hypothetical protein [Bradyrhizobium icense]|nr:hypothetical protein [Bradyrhizobium icense]